MSTSVQSTTAGETAKPVKKKGLNRWDSPWLNAKFLTGLGMVLAIMLMGPIGRIVWEERLSYPASSPLNLPPPWAPGYDQTGLRVVEQTATVSSAATATPVAAQPDAAQSDTGEETASTTATDTSVTGGNPFAKPTAGATQGGSSVTGGNPFAKPTEGTTQNSSSVTGGNPLAKPTPQGAQQSSTQGSRQLVGAAAYARFGVPTWDHPLGTESSGRDMLAVLL